MSKMSNKSYVIWNNKGGVGKSTITFHIASLYAQNHPNEDIIVIDMCPQANSSMMLLGGGSNGERHLQSLISLSTPKTVVGYITSCIINDQCAVTDYIINVNDFNKALPKNIFLLSGDGNLELIAPLLSERADAKPLSEKDKPWERVHSIIKDLTKTRVVAERPCAFFIDTNPSFSVYTQMAILAGESILIPINADDSSIFAITGLFNLIWGTTTPHPVYGNYTFSNKVNNFGIDRPKIALLLGNRFTQKIGAAHAFKALSSEAVKQTYQQYLSNPERFVNSADSIGSQEDFERIYSVELRDFNSAGVVAANQGIPLSSMDKYTYKVYGEEIQVSADQRQLCRETIQKLVDRL